MSTDNQLTEAVKNFISQKYIKESSLVNTEKNNIIFICKHGVYLYIFICKECVNESLFVNSEHINESSINSLQKFTMRSFLNFGGTNNGYKIFSHLQVVVV